MYVSWPVICLTFAAGFEIVMAVAARSRMRTIAAKPFMLGLLLAAVWAINYALDLSTASFDDKLLLLRLRFTFLPFYPLVWFETAYRLAYGRRCLYSWRLALASIVPAITVALDWFPSSHEFLVLQRNFHLDLTGIVPLLRFSPGPWSSVFYGFAFSFVLASILVLFTAPPDVWDRHARRLFGIAYIIGAVLNGAFAFQRSPTPGLNYGPILAPLSYALILVALRRGRMFRLALQQQAA